MFKKKSDSIDHGLALPYKCSNCSSFGLNLKELPFRGTGYGILNLYLKSKGKTKSNWVYECNECGLQTDLDEDEVPEVIELKNKADELSAGTISDKDFMQILSSSTSNTVQEIYKRSFTWTCDACQNEVPPTFEVCWNCGAECPEPEKLIQTDTQIQINTSCLTGSSYELRKNDENNSST